MPKLVAQWMLKVSAFLFVIACSPETVLAEVGQLNIATDLEYLYSNIETRDKLTGLWTTETDSSRFKREYDIELLKEIYPYLNLRLGGLFELIDTDTASETRLADLFRLIDTDTETEERSSWLFAELNLDNPLYTAGAAYRRREFDFDQTAPAKTKTYREEYTGLFRWRPVGFPRLDLDFTRFRIWDNDDTRDSALDRFILESRYDYRGFSYDYTYTRNDEDDRIQDSETLNQIHNGRLNYSNRFFGDRLLLTSGIRLNYQKLDLSGTGDFMRPVITPGAELFRQDDNPVTPWTLDDLTDALAANSIIIGSLIPPPGPASAGLEFDSRTNIDTVYLLPETGDGFADPNEIAAISFSWDVYVSDNGLDWDGPLANNAIYDRTENRFKITFPSFPPVETSFIKVVTIPETSISGRPVVIGAVQPFRTIKVAGTDRSKIEDFDQTYNLGLQWAITDRTTASYDAFYRKTKTEPEPFDTKRTTLTEGISLRHLFGPRLFANARLLQTYTTETDRGKTLNHSYTASITADHFDTLRQTLIYSGRYDKDGDRTSSGNSIFLRTDADLYEGWSADLDLGYSWEPVGAAPDTGSTTLRVSTNVDSNPRLSFTLDYLVSWNTQKRTSSSIDHNARFQGFWHPVRTLSFFAGVSLRDKESEGEGLKVTEDYSVSWAPFPDGWLNLSLAYNHSVDTNDNDTWALSPQIDWQITRNTFLTLRFNFGTIESEIQTSNVKNIRATLRTSY